MNLRAAIVDDEELARRGLRIRLEKHGDVEIVAECRSGAEAIAAIEHVSPDVVFLDVEMPGKTGLDVIQAIGPTPQPYVVFVTAHDRYAIRAFEVNALDYLMKPVTDERLAAALQRVRDALATETGPAEERGLTSPTSRPDRFALRSGGRVVLVKAEEIDWVEAQGDYVGLHVGKKCYLLRETLTALARSLETLPFARIHRSTIVNIDRILEMQPLENGEYVVALRDGTELKLSRSYREPLQRLVAGRI